MSLAHLRLAPIERCIADSRLGATKPVSSEQRAKLALGRKRAAMAGRSKRADKKLRRF